MASERTAFIGEKRVGRQAAALAAAGILALTLAGEANRAAAAPVRAPSTHEVYSTKDPLSHHIDEGLTKIMSNLKLLVRQNATHAYHQAQTDKYGVKYDRYTYAQRMLDATTGKFSYLQIVCLARRGHSLPDGCELLFGVDDPRKSGQPFEIGQFIVRDPADPNGYDLEAINNLAKQPTETYYTKDGQNYYRKERAGGGAWHTSPLSRDRITGVYDDCISGMVDILEQVPHTGGPAA